MKELADKYNRRFKKLRVSLTSRCNFACTYCVEDLAGKDRPLSNDISGNGQGNSVLSVNELVDAIVALNELCEFESIRLTGGEPLMYNELLFLIEKLSQYGIRNIKITTNGFLIVVFAEKLARLGLRDINVSLDAIDREKFFKITKRDYLYKVLDGINTAIKYSINVKLNAVIMKDTNHDQVLPLLEYAGKSGVPIRFLELMGMGHLYNNYKNHLFTEQEILDMISTKYDFDKLPRAAGSTANYWKIRGTGNIFGIISNVSNPFCFDCNRLRLDSNGKIYGCIGQEDGLDIKQEVNNKPLLWEKLEKALTHKQPVRFKGSVRPMIQVGG